MMLYETSPQFETMGFSYPNFLDWRKQTRTFEQIGAFQSDDLNLTGPREAERIPGKRVSARFFSALGVKPMHGRTFLEEEDRPGGNPVVILAAELWKSRFGSDPDILGKSLALNGTGHTVVGILPSGFTLYGSARLFVPIGQWDNNLTKDRGVNTSINVVGRLRPSVSIAQARADLDNVARHLADEYPKTNAGHGAAIIPLKQAIVGAVRPTLFVLFGAVGFVLLIACANVANLLLARSAARKREFAIRTALGGDRFRLVRQLFTESILLAVTGGALGLALASSATKTVLAAIPSGLPRMEEIGLDWRVLAFTLLVSILTSIIFGLAPALQSSKSDLQESLKEGGRGAGGGSHRVQNCFVVSQVALGLVLLFGAALMIRSLWRLWGVNPGFDPHNVLFFQVGLSPANLSNPDRIRAIYEELLTRLTPLPGVHSAAVFMGVLPMTGDTTVPFWVEGRPRPPSRDQMSWATFYLTSPGYIRAMRFPLLRGRFITDQDRKGSLPVVVIDEVLAHSVFADEDPIGKTLNIEYLGSAQIVGIVAHVKHAGLDKDANAMVRSQIYLPYLQLPDPLMKIAGNGAAILLRTTTDPLGMVSVARRQVYDTGRDQPIYNIGTMEQIVQNSLAARRFLMLLLGSFAAVALILAAIGIYGVLSYSVSQRTHEMGLRMALGAQKNDVLKLVVGQGFKLTLIGVGIGIIGAPALTRSLSSLLYGVKPTDPLTSIAVSLILAAVALVACYLPARRATKVDPMVALRYE
jgi:predicted permease